MTQNRSSYHSHFGKLLGRSISVISLSVRKKMYHLFEKEFGHPQSVLDIGVTSESLAPEANFFEELFPFKDRITAAGIEDAEHLVERYPGLKFVKVKAGEPLPFADNQFEVVFSNAVIEHIVDEVERVAFLAELMRVGKSVFLTTPNKYFPIEHHTGTPLIHFLWPKLFFKLLNNQTLSKFYNAKNLRPLSKNQLRQTVLQAAPNIQIHPIRLFGVTSNYVAIAKKERP